jgi:hypothetical protein
MVNPEKNGNMLMIKVVSSSVMAQCNFINLKQEHILKLSEKKIFFSRTVHYVSFQYEKISAWRASRVLTKTHIVHTYYIDLHRLAFGPTGLLDSAP